MQQHTGRAFPYIDRQLSLRMGIDLASVTPGQTTVVETPLRLQCETVFKFTRALWWVWLTDGRSVVSVPPGCSDPIQRILPRITAPEQLHDAATTTELQLPVNAALERAGMPPVDRVFFDLNFSCTADLLIIHRTGDCCRLTDESIPPADGIKLPTHCFPDGIVYGVIVDGKVVSCSFTHSTGVVEASVADIAVVTAPAYRNRDYAKTVVSALTAYVTQAGGEVRYACDPDNAASIATARSVGFVPYGHSLLLCAPEHGTERHIRRVPKSASPGRIRGMLDFILTAK